MAAGSALLLALALALPATAQPIDDATRNAARELAHRAGQAYKKGDYEKAQDLYHRSYALVPAPTLSLREARALVKLGRLVEAAEAYVRTTRTSLESDSPTPFREAVQQAYDELGKLRPQIPQLEIVVKGETPDDGRLTVKMDGKRVSAALIGVAGPADPGSHQLTATTESGATASGSITLKQGETKSIELDLDHTNLKAPGSGATPTTPKDSNPKPVTPPPGGDKNGTAKGGSMQRSLGFVGLGVGAAGLGVGIVTGLMATSREKSAEDKCPGHHCVNGSQGAKDLDAFRSLRTVSTIGYVVGGVGVAAGVTLLLTAPKSKPAAEKAAALDRPHWAPYVGLGSTGIAGTF